MTFTPSEQSADRAGSKPRVILKQRGPAGVAEPSLRLVGEPTSGDQVLGLERGAPAIENPTDPRWVLALRVSESLEGTVISPEKRRRLLSLGRLMGLTDFDGNLIIAMIQDQARRGVPASRCPHGAEPQLRMVALPGHDAKRGSVWPSLIAAGGLMALELAFLVWVL